MWTIGVPIWFAVYIQIHIEQKSQVIFYYVTYVKNGIISNKIHTLVNGETHFTDSERVSYVSVTFKYRPPKE
jgi:hypothetical protein